MTPRKRTPWLSPVRAAGRLWSSVRRPSSASRRHPLQRPSSSSPFHSTRTDIASAEDFKELQTLGKGSFGEVLLVSAKINGSLYAVKIIHIDCLGDDATMLEQIRQERHALEVVRGHPHVVCLHNSWETEASLYLVLQYIPGRDLFETVRRRKRLSSAAAARYVLQLAMALEFLRSKDIVFRDLKLENVMVNHETDCAVLTDFGLAKQLESPSHRTRTICGTIQYMAPEILREEPYGSPADWWCLGVVAYILVCGRYPFSAGIDTLRYDHGAHDRMVMSRRIEECDLPFPSFVDCAAEVVVRKLMDPQPVDRISSYKQLEPMKWFEHTRVEPLSVNHLRHNSGDEDPSDTQQGRPTGLEEFSGSYLEFLLSPGPKQAAHAPGGDSDGSDAGDSERNTTAEAEEDGKEREHEQEKGDGGKGVDAGAEKAHVANNDATTDNDFQAHGSNGDEGSDQEAGASTGKGGVGVSHTPATGRVAPVAFPKPAPQQQQQPLQLTTERAPPPSCVEPCNTLGEEQRRKVVDTAQPRGTDGRASNQDGGSGAKGIPDHDDSEQGDFLAMVRQFAAKRKLAPQNKLGATASRERRDEWHQQTANVLQLQAVTSSTASSRSGGHDSDFHSTSDGGASCDSDEDAAGGALLHRTASARDTLFTIILSYQRRQYHDQRSMRSDGDSSGDGFAASTYALARKRHSPQQEQHEAWKSTTSRSSSSSAFDTLACTTNGHRASSGGNSTDTVPYIDDAWHDVSELL